MKRRHKHSGWDLTQHLKDEEEAEEEKKKEDEHEDDDVRSGRRRIQMKMQMGVTSNQGGT